MAYALLNVVRTYPQSSIHDYAASILRSVNDEYHLGLDLGAIAMVDEKSGEEKPKSPYNYEPATQHLVMIVFNPKKVRVEPLKVRISDFNKREHRVKDLEVKNLVLDDKNMIVTLSIFNNETEANDYITSMFLTDYVFGGIDRNDFSVLPISVANYAIFFKEKKLVDYVAFLMEHGNKAMVTTIDPSKANEAANTKEGADNATKSEGKTESKIDKKGGDTKGEKKIEPIGNLKGDIKGPTKGQSKGERNETKVKEVIKKQ